MLNVRVEGWKSPIRILCDSGLPDSAGWSDRKSAGKYRTIVAYADSENTEAKRKDYMKWELRRSAVRMKTIRWILKTDEISRGRRH